MDSSTSSKASQCWTGREAGLDGQGIAVAGGGTARRGARCDRDVVREAVGDAIQSAAGAAERYGPAGDGHDRRVVEVMPGGREHDRLAGVEDAVAGRVHRRRGGRQRHEPPRDDVDLSDPSVSQLATKPPAPSPAATKSGLSPA